MHSILMRRRGRAAAAAAVTVAALFSVLPVGGTAGAAETPAEIVIPADTRADLRAGLLPVAGLTGFLQGPLNGPNTWFSYADGRRTPLTMARTSVVRDTGSDVIAQLSGDVVDLWDPRTGTARRITVPQGQQFRTMLGTSVVTSEAATPRRWHLLTLEEDRQTDQVLTLPEGATGITLDNFRSPYGFLLSYTLDGATAYAWVGSSFTAQPVDFGAPATGGASRVGGTYLFRFPVPGRMQVWDLKGDFSAPVRELDWAGGTPVAVLGDYVLTRLTESGGTRLVARPLAGGADLPVLDEVTGSTPVAPDGRVLAVRADGEDRIVHAIRAGADGGPPAVSTVTGIPQVRTRVEKTAAAQGMLQTYGMSAWNRALLGAHELAVGGEPTAGPRQDIDGVCVGFDCSTILPTGDGRSVIQDFGGQNLFVYGAGHTRPERLALNGDQVTGPPQASGRYVLYPTGAGLVVIRNLDTGSVVLRRSLPDRSNPLAFLTGDSLWETTDTPGDVEAIDVRTGNLRHSDHVADCDLTDLQVNGTLLYWACGTRAGVHDTLSGQDVTVPAYDGAVLGDGYLAHQQDGVLSLTPLRGGGATRVIGNPSKAGVNFSVDRFGGPLVFADDQDRVHVVPSGVPASDLAVLDSDTPEILDGDTAGASWSGRWWLSKPAASWTLTVKDRSGTAVRTLSGGEARGLVKAVWDGNGEGGSALADDRYTFELAATPADGSGPQLRSTGEVFLTHGRLGTYEPVAPARILDTRSGLGAPQAKVGPGHTVTLQVTGRGGIPTTGVTAVTMNVTATNPTATGYVTVFPDGEPVVPGTSSLNVTAGRTVPNLVTVPVRDGKITLYNHTGSVDLLADVAGYYTLSGAGGRFRPVAPGRVLDTRSGLGAPRAEVGAARTVTLQVAGRGGVPATGVTAVTMNVTATNPTTTGYVTVYPYGTGRPSTSNLNTTAGQTVANLVTVPVKDGKVTLYNHAGTVDLLADVAGYFSSDEQGDRFAALTPTRILDTRSGFGAGPGALAPGGTVTVQVQGWAGLPASGVSAVVLNVTVTNPTAAGYVSVYPYGMPRPATSNVSVAKGQTVANQVVVPVKDGKVTLFNHAGTAHLLADVAGYYTR